MKRHFGSGITDGIGVASVGCKRHAYGHTAAESLRLFANAADRAGHS